MRHLIILPLAAFALAACGASADDGKTGTDISIDATTDEGETIKASSDGKTGEVAIDAPGFKANIAMPKVNLDSDNFEMNGAKLYPGSKIISMKVDNVMRAAGSEGGAGTVRISFDAPASPDVVKAWFLDQLVNTAKYSLKVTPDGMTGTNEDGDPFTLNLRAGEVGHSIGSMIISAG
jgi:hypothetical protein